VVAENLMDISHVHATHSFGDPSYARVEPYEVNPTASGASATVNYRLAANSSLFLPSDHPTRGGLTQIDVEMHFPGCLDISFKSGKYIMRLFITLTPESARVTKLRYFLSRNYYDNGLFVKIFDWLALRKIKHALSEDQQIVETIFAQKLPPIALSTDNFLRLYRLMWIKLSQGDEVDDTRDATLLPSVARAKWPIYGRLCSRLKA